MDLSGKGLVFFHKVFQCHKPKWLSVFGLVFRITLGRGTCLVSFSILEVKSRSSACQKWHPCLIDGCIFTTVAAQFATRIGPKHAMPLIKASDKIKRQFTNFLTPRWSYYQIAKMKTFSDSSFQSAAERYESSRKKNFRNCLMVSQTPRPIPPFKMVRALPSRVQNKEKLQTFQVADGRRASLLCCRDWSCCS